MTARTRSRVSSLSSSGWIRARETVATDTPSSLATSLMVTGRAGCGLLVGRFKPIHRTNAASDHGGASFLRVFPAQRPDLMTFAVAPAPAPAQPPGADTEVIAPHQFRI